MGFTAAATAIGAGASVYGAYKSAKSSDRAAGAAERSANTQAQVANRQLQLSEDQWNHYLDTYRPLEDSIVAEAQSGVDPSRYIGQASSDVSKSFDKARASSDRQMGRYGINPNSGRFAAINRGFGIAQAGADATARNQARNRVEDMNWARKLDALSLGKGLPAQASTGMTRAGVLSGSSAKTGFGVAKAYGDQASSLGRFGINMADRSGWFNSGGQSVGSTLNNTFNGGIWDGDTGYANADGSTYYDPANDFYS